MTVTRPLPKLLPWSSWFWTSGEDGQLRIQGCDVLRRAGPPAVAALSGVSECGVVAAGVSGRATVIGVTVNHQQWLPGFAPPYVIANVALTDDPSIHLTTNIVGCDPDDATSACPCRSCSKSTELNTTGVDPALRADG